MADESNDHEEQCMARHPGFGCTCEQIQFEDRQREVAQMYRDEDARRKTQGERTADHDGAPDVVGRLVDLVSFLEKLASLFGDRVEQLDKIAEKGAGGLQDLAALISQRIHFTELLDRAAKIIDPDTAQASYEEQLDWLAKWREVVGR